MRPPSREDVQAAQSHLVLISRASNRSKWSKRFETLCDINAIVVVSWYHTMATADRRKIELQYFKVQSDAVLHCRFFWGSTEVQDAPAPAAGDFLEVQETTNDDNRLLCESHDPHGLYIPDVHQSTTAGLPSQDDCVMRSRQSSFGIRVACRFIAYLEAFDGRAEQRLVQSQQRLNSFDLLFWIY